ncbi:MAG: hypothetical protein D6B26_01690 [Spirochaetaceae bacterium]|nr:MAG: hypothetical protein D6B26_01690 [Spirochaetaceae bacterium]
MRMRIPKRQFHTLLGLIFLILALSSCAMQSAAIRAVSNVMTGSGEGGNAFTSDNDPEFVEDALPFAIKLYETLLQADPENPALYLSTGSLYISYANAFLQSKAALLPITQHEERATLLSRARNLYLRGHSYVLQGLALESPKVLPNGFEQPAELTAAKKQDVPYLYWAAAGILGALSTDPMSSALGVRAPAGVAMANRALELQPDYNRGAIHDILLSYYGGAPASLGGSQERAREHFRESVRLGEGSKPGPYVALATTVAIQNQDMQEFVSLLEQALEVDIEKDPDNQLVNVLSQRKARYYLKNRDNYILDPGASDEDEWAAWDDWEE